MKRKIWTTTLTCITLLMVLSLCLLPGGGPAPTVTSAEAAEAGDRAAAEGAEAGPADTAPQAQAKAGPAATQSSYTAAAAPVSTPKPGAAMTPEDPAGEEEASTEEGPFADTPVEPASGAPTAAAWISQPPADFTVSYTITTHAARCTWSAVTDPPPGSYRVYKWRKSSSYTAVNSVYSSLAAIEPSAQPYYEEWYARINASMSGLTYTEKQAALEALEVSTDALNGILCFSAHPDAAGLLTQLKNAAMTRRNNGTSTTWNDTNCANNNYYWYAVVTRDKKKKDSSPFSHTEHIFSIRNNTGRPAVPKSVTAKAYDPGVFVEWARNTDADLAGYNVYRVNGSTWTRLNTSLITTGTEFYYPDGTAGQVFGVTAVDTSSPAVESRRTSKATAALQPATTYLATDPGWATTGTWAVEYYTKLPPPDTGPADLLVAQDAGAVASHAFTGRRVKLYVSTYWSCGSAEVLVDGQVRATVSLSGGDTPAWGTSVFTLSGLPKGSHTFAVRCLGSGGTGGFNFVNVQYIEIR